MKKVCFKSDGTTECGAKIIAAIVTLGGCNPRCWGGANCGAYYYVDEHNNITNSTSIPCDYTLIDPDEILCVPKFPRKMRVRNHSTDGWVERIIIADLGSKCTIRFVAVSSPDEAAFNNGNFFSTTNWREAEETSCAQEITMDEIAAKFNIPVAQLKIKK